MSERPTASTITDDQLDALWDALDQIEALHSDYAGYCRMCGGLHPCLTIEIISRQRSLALESTCPRSTAGRND
jgi:hypothetical protein